MRVLPLPNLGPRFALIRDDGMKHDFVRRLWRVGAEAFAPVVADGVGEDGSAAVEVGGANGAADFWVAFKTVFGVLVPEVECAVAAGGAEGTMLGVKAYGVDAVDVADVPAACRGGLTVAFEAEVGGGILFLDVLDGAAAFDAADCEA